MGKGIGIGIIVVLALGLAAWALGWVFTPLGVTSADNVRQQFAFAYSLNESMVASARQACEAKRAVDEARTDEERVQRVSQLLAIKNNYARIARDYDARMRDAFQAKYVAPSDVPSRAPTLNEMKRRVCD